MSFFILCIFYYHYYRFCHYLYFFKSPLDLPLFFIFYLFYYLSIFLKEQKDIKIKQLKKARKDLKICLIKGAPKKKILEESSDESCERTPKKRRSPRRSPLRSTGSSRTRRSPSDVPGYFTTATDEGYLSESTNINDAIEDPITENTLHDKYEEEESTADLGQYPILTSTFTTRNGYSANDFNEADDNDEHQISSHPFAHPMQDMTPPSPPHITIARARKTNKNKCHCGCAKYYPLHKMRSCWSCLFVLVNISCKKNFCSDCAKKDNIDTDTDEEENK